MSRSHIALFGLATALVLTACGQSDSGEVESNNFRYFSGTPKKEIGQFFMVDHYGIEAQGYADVHDKIRNKNLGAVIFWNPNQASGPVARQMIKNYSATARAAGNLEVFYSVDQEEYSTQRFSAKHGFSDLASGNALGRAYTRDGNARACELHARITARELASTGINMALGTVADLYHRNSGTPGMFRTRAIHSDPGVVATCIATMAQTYGQEKHVVFVTKHFPGLGNASGNTDVDAAVKTFSTSKETMERELIPYRTTTAAVNSSNTWQNFATMISHAAYKILDPNNQPATLSPRILSVFLRTAPEQDANLGGIDASGQVVTFKGIGFKGVTISDAFWTWGATRSLTGVQLNRLMVRSFLAGMDVLMISKTDFNGAWDYFQAIYRNQLPEAEQKELVKAVYATNWNSLRVQFANRVDQSWERIKAAKSTVGFSTSFMGEGNPSSASAQFISEYRELTR